MKLHNETEHRSKQGLVFKKELILQNYMPEERPNIINKFIKFVRDKNKVIIDIDKIKNCKTYRAIFTNTYMMKLVTEPNKFVAYQSGIGFNTDNGELYSWQIKYEKFFETYYYVLTNKLLEKSCRFCKIQGYRQTENIYIICMWCRAEICKDCFEECSSVYFRYNNQFKCLNCKEINWWDD